MTEKMTMEQALGKVLGFVDMMCVFEPEDVYARVANDALKQAAYILRKKATEPVVKDAQLKIWHCKVCKERAGNCTCVIPRNDNWYLVDMYKTWTEHTELKPVTVRSEPVFEKAGRGSDD